MMPLCTIHIYSFFKKKKKTKTKSRQVERALWLGTATPPAHTQVHVTLHPSWVEADLAWLLGSPVTVLPRQVTP
jgi:hypothetical protein